MFKDWYKLVDDKPVAVTDLIDFMHFMRWFENAENRKVARTDVDSTCYVSTVFLAIDHNHDREGDPILWETVIFGGSCAGQMFRATSKEEALENHKQAVEMAKRKRTLQL